MKNITLNIPAIHCDHCAHTIKMELSEIEGVHSVDVDTQKKQASIAFEQPATEKMINNLLIEINYPPEV